MNYRLTHLLGSFTIEQNKLTTKKPTKTLSELPLEKHLPVLLQLKDKKNFAKLYQENCKLTKQAIKESVSEDQLIIQAIANINELDKTSNLLTKRLREWYSLYLPEASEQITSNEKFVDFVNSKTKQQLTEEFSIKETMGADLSKPDVAEIILLAKTVAELFTLRKKHELYLEKIMKKYCPNFLELAGTTIAAKLLELAKSLKKLAMLPASTIQLLGAEKALFRHIKTGARSPKYGILFQHPFVQKAKRSEKGKIARIVADKLSLCARLDYFKGEFKAPEYRKMIEEKLE